MKICLNENEKLLFESLFIDITFDFTHRQHLSFLLHSELMCYLSKSVQYFNLDKTYPQIVPQQKT